jgi:uncharacterized protein YqfA (UPF0365 family)
MNSMQIERSKEKFASLYCRDAAADDEIAQIESHAQACLSMTEMQAMTRSVKTMHSVRNNVIDASQISGSTLTPAGPIQGQLCEA